MDNNGIEGRSKVEIDFDTYKKENISVRKYLKLTGKDKTTPEQDMNEAIELLRRTGCEKEASYIEKLKQIDIDAVARQICRDFEGDVPGNEFNRRRDIKELVKLYDI